jgi:hypothetical protein
MFPSPDSLYCATFAHVGYYGLIMFEVDQRKSKFRLQARFAVEKTRHGIRYVYSNDLYLHLRTHAARFRYLFFMKILFIASTLAIVYQMRFRRIVKVTYDKERDTFRSEILVGASVLLAFMVHEGFQNKGMFHYRVPSIICS